MSTDLAQRLLVKVEVGREIEKREVILKQDWIYTDVAVGMFPENRTSYVLLSY